MTENTEKATEQAAEKTASAPAAAPTPKKGGMKRWQIVLAVVIVVIVVAGAGMFAWHNSPSFCGTVCHTPMSKYVSDFEAGSSTTSTAKLAAYHGTKNSMNCLSCHEAKIDEQVTEGMSWISGNYNFNATSGQLQSRSDQFATSEFCLRSGCHDGITTADDLTQATSDLEFNPHDWSQHGYIACGNCHKAHETSEFYCTQCHLDATFSSVPEGWNVKIDGTTYTKENGQLKEQ